jgi:hypothetical protein
MDEERAFKRPENITVEQAATIGVGALVSDSLTIIRSAFADVL